MEIEELVEEYETGEISLTELSKREHVTRWWLTERFKKLGVDIVNRHNLVKFNENVFDVIDTEEKAYWLGFLYADGNISSHAREKDRNILEVSLKGDDWRHLVKFNDFLGFKTSKVSVSDARCNGKTFKRCRIHVSNKHLWNTLNAYGCVPRKSLVIEFPSKSIFSDDSLIRHFVRGYFDGNGSISRHIHVHVVSPNVSLVSTNRFLDEMSSLVNIPSRRTHHKKHPPCIGTLYFNKDDGIRFMNYVYGDCSVYLDRKYSLYQFFKNGSRPVEEFIGLSWGNIGGEPEMGNTEISDGTKKPSPSYSVGNETINGI